MRGYRTFGQRGSNLVDEGEGGSKYHYKRVIIGPPAKRHLNEDRFKMAFRWRADYNPTLNAGLVVYVFSEDPDQYC